MPSSTPRRGRTPGRRFLALASDAVYTSQPPRRLESTSLADPESTVELVAAATSLRDEPECISGAILDSYGRDAVFFQGVRHAALVDQARAERADLTVEQRLATCWERAKRQHRSDVRGGLLAVEKAVERAQRGQAWRIVEDEREFSRLEREPVVLPAAQLERLERVEALLDRAPDLEQLQAAA